MSSAMAKFRQLDLKNTEAADEGLPTVHQNSITYVLPPLSCLSCPCASGCTLCSPHRVRPT